MNDLNDNPRHTSTDKEPFFSIIIPVYNAEKYLQECLESIVAQDHQDWEAILVDDGSSDSSLEIAEEFSRKNPCIRVFRSDRNSGGAYVPRLRAASLSKGKYIVTIDADDKVSPYLLKTLRRHIAKDGADLVIPEMWRIEGSVSYKILPLDSIDVSRIWSGKDLVGHTLCNWDIPMCGFAIRREAYLEADRMVAAEDRKSIFADELLSRWILFLSRKVAMCNARYYYRQNGESVTHVNLPRFIDSKMRTCDGLVSMISEAFGEQSATFELGLKNKMYSVIELLRLINRSELDRKQRGAGVKRISSAMKGFDFNRLKGKTSPRYLALMRLPIPLARVALKIIDPIIYRKNGI